VAFPIREYWLDVGRLTDFTQANRDVAEGLLEPAWRRMNRDSMLFRISTQRNPGRVIHGRL
jgi:NDP-sugar pyrophosphorylase family protein